MSITNKKERNAPAEFVRWPDLLTQIPLGRNTIQDMISRGEFPRPVPLAARSVGFIREEVDAWIAQRVSARNQRAHV